MRRQPARQLNIDRTNHAKARGLPNNPGPLLFIDFPGSMR